MTTVKVGSHLCVVEPAEIPRTYYGKGRKNESVEHTYRGTIDGAEICVLYGNWCSVKDALGYRTVSVGFWSIHWALPEERRVKL